jgi:uncharacterized membrane protein YbhN (UPF0104 family)
VTLPPDEPVDVGPLDDPASPDPTVAPDPTHGVQVNAADEVDGVDEVDDEAPARPGGKAVGASTVVGLVLGGLAMAYVVKRFASEWDKASDAVHHAHVGWLVAALVLAAAGMASVGWGWKFVLRLLGVRVPTGRVVSWYFVGEIGKYLPGGVWPVLGRGELARRGGVPRTRAYASVAMSLGILYLSALFVSAALLPFAFTGGSGFSPWMLFLLCLPIGIVVLHHDVLAKVVALVARITKREIDIEIPAWKDSLALVARYVPAWFFIGTATWCVARAFTPDASYPKVMFATVLAWTAGFLAVPVPAGAGIREAVLLAASGLGPLSATTVLVARVLFIAVDAGGAGLCAPIAGRKRAGVTVGPLPHPDEAHR